MRHHEPSLAEINSLSGPVHRRRVFLSILTVYLSAACLVGLVLELSGCLWRIELQTFSQRFELRPWLCWSKESLKRLNLRAILDYHDKHEIPRRWYAWDYTLSWLIENNHPAVRHNIVIFNHSYEDEPPSDAASNIRG